MGGVYTGGVDPKPNASLLHLSHVLFHVLYFRVRMKHLGAIGTMLRASRQHCLRRFTKRSRGPCGEWFVDRLLRVLVCGIAIAQHMFLLFRIGSVSCLFESRMTCSPFPLFLSSPH